ncbi:MAG: glutamate synthase subunit beta [Armatimonadetes bacterium]|nr:glutamate synthase subunit beta [Armatimonadota bacterium]
MADPRGFLKFERRLAPLRPVEERVRDWREVQTPPDAGLMREQAARCMDCGVPFCHKGCPLGNIIPDFNDLLYRGRLRDALDRLHATNNFPEFTGRLCPAPCEYSCVLGYNQPAVTIKQIEQYIVDQGFENGWIAPQQPERRTGRSVAVVGSGPAGLAAAQQLNRAGHTVTVFERADRIGGLLRYGIPDFKLDKRVLDRRLRLMQEEGVVFRAGIDVGSDITAAELRAQFDAVCLAIGSTAPRDLPVPGRDLKGIHFAADYLTQQNRAVAAGTAARRVAAASRCAPRSFGPLEGHEPAPDDCITAHGKRVVIIGGGDTGADCLGTAIRQGAAQITQIELLPKPPAERDDTMPWPTYPMILRTSSAHEEGGIRDWAVNTVAFSGADGHVERLECVRVEFGDVAPASRRQPMQTVPGSEFTIEADIVFLAMGFLSPEHPGLLDDLGVEYDARGNVRTGDNRMTSVRAVFAAGDARRGQSLIVWAIAEGREAAREIDRFLMGDTRLP